MQEPTHIELDVHKESIAVALLRPGVRECDERVIPNTPEALRKLLSRFEDADALRVCHEVGPTGYDTQRLLASLGIDCEVIAPSLVPRRAGVRVKTDRLDARNLARLYRAGELISVRVPSAAEEALRDLVRARESLKDDRRIARQRIRSFLLRYGVRCPGARDRWSHRFEVWVRALRFEQPASQEAFEHLLGACFVRNTQLAWRPHIRQSTAGFQHLATGGVSQQRRIACRDRSEAPQQRAHEAVRSPGRRAFACDCPRVVHLSASFQADGTPSARSRAVPQTDPPAIPESR